MTEYKYDLAISLMDRDKEVAKQLFRGLEKDFVVFLYTEAEKEIHFREAVELFSDVYGKEARAVLVLLRPEWGSTTFTRLEKAALKTRVFNEGAQFLFCVRMEDMQGPTWVPPNFMYAEYEKWGPDSLLHALRGTLGALGAEAREMTAVDIANQQARTEQWELLHYQKVNGADGKKRAEEERLSLLSMLKEHVEAVNKSGRGVQLLTGGGVGGRATTISRNPCSIRILPMETKMERPYVNRIRVVEYDGMVDENGYKVTKLEPNEQKVTEYAIDVDQKGNWFWRDMSSNDIVSTAKLSDALLSKLLTRSAKFDRGELEYQPPQDPEDDEDVNMVFLRYR